MHRFHAKEFGYCLAYKLARESTMSDLVRDVRQEFWRPPQSQPAADPALAEACRRCGTEFMVGAAFCHICGMGRHRSTNHSAGSWTRHFEFLKGFEFGLVRSWFGLPLPSLCAFLIGSAFVIMALAQGLRSVQDFSDFEAIQLWRIQWMMAACAAFLAGILLKNRKSES
jgi:ribosomal protein L37E